MMKTYDEKAEKIFEVMINRGLIPREDQFKITSELIDHSIEIGAELFKIKGKKRKPSDVRMHQRIAGLNMLHLNKERSEKEFEMVISKRNDHKQFCGFVYIIENPSFDTHFKIGITKNLENRLKVYQTSDPLRKFFVKKQIFVEDCRSIESEILSKYKVDLSVGEWLPVNCKNAVINLLDEISMK